jgi:hypothetical protein
MPDTVIAAIIGVIAGGISGFLGAWINDKAIRRAAVEQAHAAVLAAVLSTRPNLKQAQLDAALRLVKNPTDTTLQETFMRS